VLSALEWTSSPQTAALVQVVARASGTQPDSDPAFLHKSPRNFGNFLEIWCMQMCETVPYMTRDSRIYLSTIGDAVFVLAAP